MFLFVDIDKIDNVDVLKFICSELEASNNSLRDELSDIEKSFSSYRECLNDISDIIRSFNFNEPDLSYASDVCNTIYNIIEDFYLS